jgi:hypothetical protein
VGLFAVGIVLLGSTVSTQQPQAQPVPLDPIAVMVDAFRTHDIVAMSDAHGNEQNHAFRLKLIRDPRFVAVANDIVIEPANARYQNVVDRFVRGEAVPRNELRRAWEDTSVPTAGNNYEMVEELIDTVRAVNRSAPRDRQLRVVLGDPPIDWDTVRTRDEHQKWLGLRDSYPAALIQTEVLAKERRALVLYGHLHFQRWNLMSNYEMEDWRAQTIISLLERATPAKVFIVWSLDLTKLPADPSSWPVPSLVLIRGTTLGTADFALYHPSDRVRFSFQNGNVAQVPREQWRTMRAEEQLDAALYLGAASQMRERPSHEIPPALCSEPGFVDRQVKRIALAGVPQFEADRLKTYCRTYGFK